MHQVTLELAERARPQVEAITGRGNDIAHAIEVLCQHWQQQVEQIEAAWSEAQGALDSAGATLEDLNRALEGIRSRIPELKEHLAARSSAIEEFIGAQCAASIEALGSSKLVCEAHHAELLRLTGEWSEALTDTRETLDDTATYVATRFEDVEAVASQVATDLEGAHDEFVSRLDAELEELTSAVASFSETFKEERIAATKEMYGSVNDAVVSMMQEDFLKPVSTALEEATRDIEQTAGGIIDDAAAAAGAAIDDVVESVRGSTGENVGSREAMRPIKDELDAVIQPVKPIVDSVGALARSLGVM